MAKSGPKPIDRVGERYGRWTVLARVSAIGESSSRWRCRCECGTIAIKVLHLLPIYLKQGCNRCALLAKPEYLKLVKMLADGMTKTEAARRLKMKRQQVSRMANVIEGRTPKPRSKTHCLRGHRFTKANTYWWNGKRACRTCRAKQKREACRGAGLSGP